ncbi:hypothetical protein LGN19_14335 [Burkholderia sp. AU30198]|uniref:hypothetical protein n=1 Tax=Burkholderia sp. AU30198 TaxID=2879627 RepID=UPI001CF5CF49|nr:hypothetical protein [Burkholderia sp. AU30198]MCA8294970.1 hypothetical protein [Burkholderia sp. AU30198]
MIGRNAAPFNVHANSPEAIISLDNLAMLSLMLSLSSRCVAPVRRRGNQPGNFLKSLLILATFSGLLVVSVVQAQTTAALIGLSNDLSRHVGSSNSEQGLIRVELPHCRQFGLGSSDDLPPPNQYHFVAARDTQHAAVSTPDVALTMPSIPLPWCKSGEGRS